ncbi:MAG: transcriptional repressor LexA [Planctomycetota bacterium]
MRDLTDKQRRVLEIIKRGVRQRGSAPTYREIARALGVDVRAAYQHVTALERKGFLERTGRGGAGAEGKRGGIRLAPEHAPPLGVPVVGRVAAGTPILAEENIEEHIDLAREFGLGPRAAGGALGDPDELFLLRVRGDSMTGAGIHDGDLVLVRPQPTVNDGEIAAVIVGDEATVKRVRFREEEIVLEPANPRHRAMAFGPGDEVRVAGRVVMALRRI